MTEEKRETKYNQLVGRIGDEYYFLDYTFHHGDDFKGATGSELSPLTEDEYNERVESYFDPENMRDSWRQAVSDSSTDLSLSDWIELVKDTDGEENVIDRSYADTYGEELKKRLGDKAFEVECLGGGRCFEAGMKFDEVFNQKLVDIINQFEEEATERSAKV